MLFEMFVAHNILSGIPTPKTLTFPCGVAARGARTLDASDGEDGPRAFSVQRRRPGGAVEFNLFASSART